MHNLDIRIEVEEALMKRAGVEEKQKEDLEKMLKEK